MIPMIALVMLLRLLSGASFNPAAPQSLVTAPGEAPVYPRALTDHRTDRRRNSGCARYRPDAGDRSRLPARCRPRYRCAGRSLRRSASRSADMRLDLEEQPGHGAGLRRVLLATSSPVIPEPSPSVQIGPLPCTPIWRPLSLKSAAEGPSKTQTRPLSVCVQT